MASRAYLKLLDGMRDLHVRKSAGYAGRDNPDVWANFRRSTDFGVLPEIGCLIRFMDKVSRIASLVRDPANDQLENESVEDTAIDAAAYALIYVCLRRERLSGKQEPIWPDLDPPDEQVDASVMARLVSTAYANFAEGDATKGYQRLGEAFGFARPYLPSEHVAHVEGMVDAALGAATLLPGIGAMVAAARSVANVIDSDDRPGPPVDPNLFDTHILP